VSDLTGPMRPGYSADAPVAAIGRRVCWNAQRVVLHALVEKRRDVAAAHEVLEIIGLTQRGLRYDDTGTGGKSSPAPLTLLYGGGVSSLQSPEPHARNRRGYR
jgi:hypothetical protein